MENTNNTPQWVLFYYIVIMITLNALGISKPIQVECVPPQVTESVSIP